MGNNVSNCVREGVVTLAVIVAELFFPIRQKRIRQPHVLDFDETLAFVTEQGGSLSRFGDGEILWILGKISSNFQKSSPLMSLRLKEVLESNDSRCLICVPAMFGSLTHLRWKDRRFWRWHMLRKRHVWNDLLPQGATFGDSLLTRPYMIYRNRNQAGEKFKKLKTIWRDKRILIIEGEKTFFGVGNDLLEGAASIQRVLCPATNAFDCYEEIFAAAKKWGKGKTILIALGPTATILSYDLAREGFHAIDIGHLDIEYEWFLRNTRVKISIPGKYVNESSEKFTEYQENLLHDERYRGTIVTKIECRTNI